MKKITGIFLAIVLAVTLIACTDKKEVPLTPLEPGTPVEPITPPVEDEIEDEIEDEVIEDEIEDEVEDEVEDNLNEFDIAYTGSETTNLNNEDNDVMLGYDKNHINVETNFVGSYGNAIGLNKDGTIRLYGNRADGEGSELTITISDEVEVSELIINFAEVTSAKSNGIEVRINEELLDLDGFNYLGGEVLKVKNAGMSVITIKNIHEGGTANGQIWINNITLKK